MSENMILETGFALFVLILFSILAYSVGRKDGYKICKEEFEETFDFEWVDHIGEPKEEEK